MITLSAIPTWSDLPDTAFAIDQPVYASKIQQLAHNAKFAMARREVFVGAFTNGQTVAAPMSPIDGYQYSYGEITFFWSRRLSYNLSTGKPSGSGLILEFSDSVSNVGVVSMQTNYYVDGGAETYTNDGQLIVWLFCQRNSGLRLGAVPAFSDVDDASLAGGQAAIATTLEQLNKNVRYAAVRKEFFIGSYYNGQTVAQPVSPADGYTYQRSELIYKPSMVSSNNSSGARSASGTMRQYSCAVDPATGRVSSFVAYYVFGGAWTGTTDGKILVLTIGVRNK